MKKPRDFNKLERAVVKQLSYTGRLTKDSLAELESVLLDVYKHGAGPGFCGFITHKDTVVFFNKNRLEILSAAKELADDLGLDVLTMVERWPDNIYSLLEISLVMLGADSDKESYPSLRTALAQFALEYCARTILQK